MIDLNPAKKIAGFLERDFEHMSSGRAVMDTAEAKKTSKCLSECGEVDEELVKRYVEGWAEPGFLSLV